MSRKKRLPFWLGVVLAMVLALLLVLVAMVPEPEDEPVAPRIVIPHKQSAQTAVTQPDSAQESVKDAMKATVQPEARPQSNAPPAARGLALVLDDVGYDIPALQRILALSVPVAVSVLPDAPFARKAASLANRGGQVVMLHLPMQPEDPSLGMSEAFLHEEMNEQQVHATFKRNISKVPFVEGVNNHMGSRLTRLTLPMYWVMQLCRDNDLFFVDSRTSSESVAAEVADSLGLAWASRQIFLDHDMSVEAMKQAWEQARACVKAGRRCVVIAHPRPMTVTFLENYLTKDDASQMVSIKALLRSTPVATGATAARAAASQSQPR